MTVYNLYDEENGFGNAVLSILIPKNKYNVGDPEMMSFSLLKL